MAKEKALKIAFLHKALMYGGAERLILDMALALKEQGHAVNVYTAEYIPEKTFPEFKDMNVKKVGGFIPARIKGKLHALMNILRMWWIALYFVLSFTKTDLVVVDQITFPIPLLRLFRKNVVYYCHFPEALLNDNKVTPLVKVYRLVMDSLEIFALRFANIICFNSSYTRDKLESTFPSMKKWKGAKYVLYPCMQSPKPIEKLERPLGGQKYILTLNRFETRKRLDICIEAFALAQDLMKKQKICLVVAGGLDFKNADAKLCRKNLQEQTATLGVQDQVIFMENISEKDKEELLAFAEVFLYTPPNEHFGIGPLEAMINGVPAIGINNGGPKETISDGETGYLLDTAPKSWAEKLQQLIEDSQLRQDMSVKARKRARDVFSVETFNKKFAAILSENKLD